MDARKGIRSTLALGALALAAGCAMRGSTTTALLAPSEQEAAVREARLAEEAIERIGIPPVEIAVADGEPRAEESAKGGERATTARRSRTPRAALPLRAPRPSAFPLGISTACGLQPPCCVDSQDRVGERRR
jgi:hypothetical protein